MTDIEAPGSAGTQLPRGDNEFTVRQRTQTQLVLRRFVRHRAAMVSLVVFVLIILWAFIGPHLWHYSYQKYTEDNSRPLPSSTRSAPTPRATTATHRSCAVPRPR